MSDKQAEVKGHEWTGGRPAPAGPSDAPFYCCECGWTHSHTVLAEKGMTCQQQHAAHLAALASQVPAQPPAPPEVGWLIENTDSEWAYVTLKPTRSFRWTRDSVKALRFSRREDAESVMVFMQGWENLKVTEHLWDNGGDPVPAQGTPPVLPYEGATGHLEEHVPAPASPQVGETLEQDALQFAKSCVEGLVQRNIVGRYLADEGDARDAVKAAIVSFARTKLRAALAESDKRARADNLQVNVNDGVWLCFRDSNGGQAAIEMKHFATTLTGIRAIVINQWAEDRLAAQPTPAPKER